MNVQYQVCFILQAAPPNSSGDDTSSTILTATVLDTASNPACCGLTEIWRVRKRRAREIRHITTPFLLLVVEIQEHIGGVLLLSVSSSSRSSTNWSHLTSQLGGGCISSIVLGFLMGRCSMAGLKMKFVMAASTLYVSERETR
jgi:hypothetical protein